MKLKQLLKDPKKRRQILIAGGAIAVLVVLLILHKKSSTSTAAEPESKATTEPSSLPAERGAEDGGSGSGGSGSGNTEQLGSEIASALGANAAAQASENAQTQADIAGLVSALQAGYTNNTPGAGAQGPGAAAPPQTKTPLANANRLVNQEAGNPRKGESYTSKTVDGKTEHIYPAQKGKKATTVVVSSKAKAAPPVTNTQAGNPREGQDFTAGKYKGKNAHIYTHAVKGGVGTKHNIVIV
jgi:hypothetical protein